MKYTITIGDTTVEMTAKQLRDAHDHLTNLYNEHYEEIENEDNDN